MRRTMWGEQKARQMLEEAGFSQVGVKNLEKDFAHALYVSQKV